MNGVTGFNPSKVKKDIADFALEAGNTCADIDDAFGEFFFQLSNFWASPKAVEFSNAFTPRIESLVNEMSEAINAIVRGAINAYNYVASAHGSNSHINDIDTLVDDMYGSARGGYGTRGAAGIMYASLKESKDGLVGMNIAAVRDVIMPTFFNTIDDVINKLEALPTSIALYDADGEQQQAYESNVRGFIQKFHELNSSMGDSLSEALATETNNILIAKQKSTEVMSA